MKKITFHLFAFLLTLLLISGCAVDGSLNRAEGVESDETVLQADLESELSSRYIRFPYIRIYQAEHMPHKIGHSIPGGWRATTRDRRDYMVFGPYERGIPRTNYGVNWRLRVDNNNLNGNACRLEVYNADLNRMIWAKDVPIRSLSRSYKFISTGSIHNHFPGHRLEFRVFFYDNCQVDVDYVMATWW